MVGKLITLEGIDGSGKSTQIRLLADELRQREFDTLTTLEPGGTPLGQRLREVFLETREIIDPTAELLLFAADRAQHVNLLIKPALANGKIVISDRYADATFAYQGAGRGFSKEVIHQIIEIATAGLKPDLTLFFDLPVEKALARTASENDNDRKNNRMDRETVDFYRRVRGAYLAIAEREPQRFIIVNADAPVSDVYSKVATIVTNFLEDFETS